MHITVRRAIKDCAKALDRVSLLLEITMTALERAQASLVELQVVVDAHQARDKETITALNTLVTDLRAQLAAGPPGITEEQANTLIAAIDVIKADINSPVEAA